MGLDDAGGLGLSGRVHRTPVGAQAPRASQTRRRRRRAVGRVRVLTRYPLRLRDIAAAVGVNEHAVAQIVERALLDTPMSRAERREGLAALWPFPVDNGRIETYWYSADSVVQQVRCAIELGDDRAVRVLASGEVAADVLQPWLMPTRGLVYATESIDLSVCGLVEATAEEATLTVRVPADPTVWATAAWWHRVTEGAHGGIPTVDPMVVLEDLTARTDLGNAARERLIDWIVGR